MTKTEIRAAADVAQQSMEQLQAALQEFWDEKTEAWLESEAGTELGAAMDEVENGTLGIDSVYAWLDAK
jgi:phage host-nuclease inhibitor protein Gam